MYFTTEEDYQKTRDSGLDPTQWPYAFDADAAWKPPVVKVLDMPRPTAVIASMAAENNARALIASLDGNLGLYQVGGLPTQAPPTPLYPTSSDAADRLLQVGKRVGTHGARAAPPAPAACSPTPHGPSRPSRPPRHPQPRLPLTFVPSCLNASMPA